MDGVSEVGVEDINIASVPSHFNSVSDRPFHTGRSRFILLGNRRIKLFGDRIDDLRMFDGHYDGVTQIVIALDVCRYADLMENVRDGHLKFMVNAVDLASVKHGFLSAYA